MKKIVIMILVSLYCSGTGKVQAQATEIVQLGLNLEKLAQLKQILSDMKRGYDALHKGYSTIKDISEGNFKLHKLFLDALMEASPTVKKYHKIPKIIAYQLALVRDYKSALQRLRQSGRFSPEEIAYFGRVYSNLTDQSLRNLDELAGVVTSGKLRMSDEERLKAIDRIHDDMEEKVLFLRHFNGNAMQLALARQKQALAVQRLRTWNNLK